MTNSSSSVWKKPALWFSMLMGFSSGLPLLLTLRTLQAWVTEAGVDLSQVGLFAMAGLPYSLKFVWAPVMDRYSPFKIGRRKSWLFISQIGLVLSLIAMAFTDPKVNTFLMAVWAFVISFFSASQDIVVDAYRRETLQDNELGLGSTVYIYGYRSAMWVSGGLALILAQALGWTNTYLIMSAFMALCLFITFGAKEPEVYSQPKNFQEAVVTPFVEFFSRRGAIMVLIFILLYKVGDNIAGNMLSPFYLKMGYTKQEIGIIAKTFSLPFTLLGGLIGGILVEKLGVIRSLYIFGFLQAISTAFFSFLFDSGHNLWMLGSVICFEDITTSMGSAAFIAFMGSLTNKKFTATQYALLSSLTKVPQVFVASSAGFLVDYMGWKEFFIFCALAAIPGILLIRVMSKDRIETATSSQPSPSL